MADIYGVMSQRGDDPGRRADVYLQLQRAMKSVEKSYTPIAAANVAAVAASKGYVSALGKATKALMSQANVSPRMVLSAIRGNVANTGRNVALGLAGATVGLGMAASPTGAAVITGPLHEVAAVLGSSVLPALTNFGATLMTTADGLRTTANPQLKQETTARLKGSATYGMAGAAATLALLGLAGAPFTMGTSLALAGTAGLAAGATFFGNAPRGPAEEADFRRNRHMLLTSMQNALGPAAAIGKIEEADKRAQLAVYEDPMELRMLTIQQEILDNLRQAAVHGIKVTP